MNDLQNEINKLDKVNNSQKSNLIASVEKLDQLLLDEGLKYGLEIIRPATAEEIYRENEKWIIRCSNKYKYKSEFLVIADG